MKVGKGKLKIHELKVKSFITSLGSQAGKEMRARVGGDVTSCANERCGTSTGETFLPPCPPTMVET